MSLSRWWFDKFVDLREKSPRFTLCFFNDSMQCFCKHKHESIHQLVITWSDKHMLRDDKLKAQIKAHSSDESCKLYRRLHVEINRERYQSQIRRQINVITQQHAPWTSPHTSPGHYGMCCVFTVDHCGSGRGLWVGGVRGVRKRWVNLQTITHF